jgi:hypothetical protein
MMWEHVGLWGAFAVLCWVTVLSGCVLVPQPAVVSVPASVARQVTVMQAKPWWVENADAFVRSREPVE